MASRSTGLAARISNITQLQIGIHAFGQITPESGASAFSNTCLIQAARSNDCSARSHTQTDGAESPAGERSPNLSPRERYAVKKLVLVSPEIDKDKRSIASIVYANKSEVKIVRLKFDELNHRDFFGRSQ